MTREVFYPGAMKPSASKVYLELDKCLVVESWGGGKGHTGKNMFAYNADDKHWHGMFADNQGRVHVFEGDVAEGSAEFYGPSRNESGNTFLNRIELKRISDYKVEHGANWNMEFRGEYSRKRP